jgi:probable phosphomutase (TIGR03848 family)
MATVILVRHGRTTANTSGLLAGRATGIRLDDRGLEQAQAAAQRIAGVPLARLVSSPLERCRQTAAAIATAQDSQLKVLSDKGLTECDYGEWQGRTLKDLAKEKLWKTVQTQPSAVEFPGGETLRAMQDRAVAAVRRHDAAVEAEHGPDAVWAAVSHGDVIKSVLADALGTHLDLFQRLLVDPASLSIVRYTDTRPYVLGVNTHEGAVGWLRPRARGRGRRTRRGADAVVGGGAGPAGDIS